MTELSDPRYRDIDQWDNMSALRAIWEGQLAAVASVGAALHMLADAVDDAAARLRTGGRLVYAGAGTSIRIAVQDGTELGPTFDWSDDRLVYLIAGGPKALMVSVEGAEDDSSDAHAQVDAAGIGPADVVIGVAASGQTPFTCAALEASSQVGALTIAVACVADTPLLQRAHHAVLAQTGSEPVAGSTRMKAGTAQKVILNMISTQTMIRLGRVHAGLMVDMRAQNAKLRARACDMVVAIAGVDSKTAVAALGAADWRIKPAVLIARGAALAEAEAALQAAEGSLRIALDGK